jgi:hypothetical protein
MSSSKPKSDDTPIQNKYRQASWKDIAMEFKSERDALKGDLYRMQLERDNLIAEIKHLESTKG